MLMKVEDTAQQRNTQISYPDKIYVEFWTTVIGHVSNQMTFNNTDKKEMSQ